MQRPSFRLCRREVVSKVVNFAKSALVKPATVNVGRPGAANFGVIQEVEYVKQEAKFVYLLECLQKTAPPVIIFCENIADVDDIHIYLLKRSGCSGHSCGDGSEREREDAISSFKKGKKDVLVVIFRIFNMSSIMTWPTQIEDYVHRIGRTGRCGKTRIATIFINKNQIETTLLDLKHLLHEAKQRIPSMLAELNDPMELNADAITNASGFKGCVYCGGLGHRIHDCPKLEQQKRMAISSSRRDYFGSGGYTGEI